MRKFSCDEARAHLSDALAGEIGRPEANVLEAHLLDCDPCRDLTEMFLWQDRVIAELAGQARLEKLMSRVRTGLENLDQVTFADEERSRLSWSVSPRWVAAAAAFILALLGLLFWKPPAQDASMVQIPAAPSKVEATTPVVAPEPQPIPEKAPEQPPVPPPVENAVAPVPAVTEIVKPPAPPVNVPKAPEAGVKKETPATPPRPPDVVVKTDRKDVVTPLPKPKTLDEAVRGGMAFLKEKAVRFGAESKTDELLLWTWLQAGMPEGDPEFQALLKAVLDKKLERTYHVSLMAMALEDLDRVKYQKRIAQCAQFLLDNQCANGQWDYGAPTIFVEEVNVPPTSPKSKKVPKVVVTRKREGPASGDNSNSMYAMLGLRACHDASIVIPRATVELASKFWRESQSRSSTVKGAPLASAAEGWCYSRHEHKPYGSMTAGGVGSLVICDYILNLDWKKDAHVLSGMEWLAKNFSVAYNPGPYEHAAMEINSQHQYYYYMYALERAAILYGVEQIGGNYWFAKGVSALVDAQREDGSWRSRTGDATADTCFAILFLRKATRALIDVPTPGAGSTPKK
jgi:hypothetical protein